MHMERCLQQQPSEPPRLPAGCAVTAWYSKSWGCGRGAVSLQWLELGQTPRPLHHEHAGTLLLYLQVKWKRIGNTTHKLTHVSVAPVADAHEGIGKQNGDFPNSLEIKDLSEWIQPSWVFWKAAATLSPQHHKRHYQTRAEEATRHARTLLIAPALSKDAVKGTEEKLC